MPTTYEPIATTTLGTSANTITFSSIPSTYTDLRLVFLAKSITGATAWRLRFNSDSGTNYSRTILAGTGTSAVSSRGTSETGLQSYAGINTTTLQMGEIDIFNYAGSTYKTGLHTQSFDQNGSGSVAKQVFLWQSTSAINSLSLIGVTYDFATGTTATLYGILKA